MCAPGAYSSVSIRKSLKVSSTAFSQRKQAESSLGYVCKTFLFLFFIFFRSQAIYSKWPVIDGLQSAIVRLKLQLLA